MATSSLRALPADQFDYWKAQHLLNRAGFGGTPSQVRSLANLGLNAAVDHLVGYQQVTDEPVRPDRFDRNIMRPATAAERDQIARARERGDEATVDQYRRERQRRQQADRQQIREIQKWWLKRMIESPRPLEEKMCLFWHGHFATNYRAIENSYHLFKQNQLFRTHAAGNVRALTHGVVHDPAMLQYLNNNQNRKEAPNENLARELMELFTLGEGNDYTEQDIKEGARALTGYTYEDDSFMFRQRNHDAGPKRILGRRGNWDGDDFVEIIFTRPAVSEFICFKLYRYFVNDLPGPPPPDTQQFILQLAKELRRSRYDLAPVLITLFRSEHFYDPSNVASLIKSPSQLVVQAVRSLRTPVRRPRALLSGMSLMGQDILYPPSVKGWPGGRTWINTSTTYVRQNLLIYLLTGQRPDAYPWEHDGATYDATHLIEHLADRRGECDVNDAAIYLLRFNLGREPMPGRVEVLTNFMMQHTKQAKCRIDNDLLIAVLSLISAMPEYQLC